MFIVIMPLVIIYLNVSMHMVCMHACVCVFDKVWVHMDMCIHVCVRAEVDAG